MVVEAALDRRRVAEIMVTAPVRIDPDATLADAIEDYFLRYGYAGFPVCRAARVEGLVSLADVRGCPPEERARRRVRDVMRPADARVRILPAATLAQALRRMGELDVGRLLVMEGEELRGLITRSGIARFVQVRMELEEPGSRF
jgi:CBS domain-containing protein